jgi:hypothetical protein
MGLFDWAAGAVQTVQNTVSTVAQAALPTGDQYQAFASELEKVQQQVASQLATLPVPGAQLFNSAPAVTATINDVVAAGYDGARAALGAKEGNPYIQGLVDQFSKYAANNAPPPSADPDGERRRAIMAAEDARGVATTGAVYVFASPGEFWPYFR